MQQESSQPPDEGSIGETAFTATTVRRRRGPLAVTVAAIAFVGFAVLVKEVAPGPTLPTPSPVPRAAVGVASFGPTATPITRPPADPPVRDPTVTPNPTVAAGPAAIGRTALVPAGDTSALLTVTLPAGWAQASPSLYLNGGAESADGESSDLGLSIGAYRIEHVNTFPCRWASGRFTETSYPNTVEGLALALSSFWGQDPDSALFANSDIAPIASRPHQTTIGGVPAWGVQILIPSVLDFYACDGDQLVLWESADGTVRTGFGSGEIDMLWVVAMNGEPLVIDAALPLLASAAQQKELQAVVDSVAFLAR
ncbi:MAG TPA: hypothetical protein VGQ31_07615 [Candidatus Limnocylindrales bacterium]|nr:hypothetical protein [Candidatus Limnocylindrales bacterium]